MIHAPSPDASPQEVLSTVTQAVLNKTKEVSGLPVAVVADPNLPTMAVSRVARGGAPSHTVLYKPSAAPRPDYLICFQCGFILREFSRPPERRFHFAFSDKGRYRFDKLFAKKGTSLRKLGLDDTALSKVGDQFFEGVLTQLRSVPVGLRIDAWLRREYPQLSALQSATAHAQLREGMEALQPQVKAIAVDEIFRANAAMNAAFALFWARVEGEPRHVVPYRAAGYEKDGQALLDLWDTIPDDPDEDMRLVDSWAEPLGLTGWYQWVAHSDLAPKGTP